MSKNVHKGWIGATLIALLGLAALMLTGCGGEKIQISIKENYITTKLEATSGQTVEEIMEEADLPVNKKDKIEPSLDTTITEDGTVINVERYAQVAVVDEDQTHEVELVGGTVDQALQEAQVSLDDNDYTDCEREAFLKDGMTINVIRVRNVLLRVNGKDQKIATSARTVEDLFKEQSVTMGKDDRLNVKLTDKITEGAKIVLDLVSTKEKTVKEEVPFETQVEYSSSMYKGQSRIKSAGVKGEKEVTYRVTYVNGKEENKVKLSEKMLKKPVAQIMVQGTKTGKRVVSRQKVMDCDGSGHGYWIIKYSDGTESYKEF